MTNSSWISTLLLTPSLIVCLLGFIFPVGTVFYVRRFYRGHLNSRVLWSRAAILFVFQAFSFILTFHFLPAFAFVINVFALPVEYWLLDRSLQREGIRHSMIKLP